MVTMMRLLRLCAWVLLVVVIFVFASPLSTSPATAMQAQQHALMIGLMLLAIARASVKDLDHSASVQSCYVGSETVMCVSRSASLTNPQLC
jgi:uncharacterized membrane protein YphA (DoxX/SURF4 family)